MQLQDFWSHVDPASADMCWEWGHRVNRDGYGLYWTEGKDWLAHRLAYDLSVAPVAAVPVVRHKCHNPRCCNPAHLLAGSQGDNMEDKVRAQRQAKGGRVPTAKLTEEQVLEIREMAQYRTQKAIADQFGVSFQLIHQIVKRKIWKHL